MAGGQPLRRPWRTGVVRQTISWSSQMQLTAKVMLLLVRSPAQSN